MADMMVAKKGVKLVANLVRYLASLKVAYLDIVMVDLLVVMMAAA
jgi:hypothetical protein